MVMWLWSLGRGGGSSATLEPLDPGPSSSRDTTKAPGRPALPSLHPLLSHRHVFLRTASQHPSQQPPTPCSPSYAKWSPALCTQALGKPPPQTGCHSPAPSRLRSSPRQPPGPAPAPTTRRRPVGPRQPGHRLGHGLGGRWCWGEWPRGWLSAGHTPPCGLCPSACCLTPAARTV